MTHITLPRETVQQAIDALDSSFDFVDAAANAQFKAGWGDQLDKSEAAITALRTALEAPAAPQAEATRIEQIAGAISKHISTSLYQREVLAAAQYIYHRYCTQAAPAAPKPLTDELAELCIQWFNAVQDLNPTYLAPADFELAKKLYERVGRRVPSSIYNGIASGAAPKTLSDFVHSSDSEREKIGNVVAAKADEAMDKLVKLSEELGLYDGAAQKETDRG